MRTIDCAGSTNIELIEHDPDTLDLRVVFKSGTYVYHGVTQEEADELDAAPSKGSHVATQIRPIKQFTKL